MTPSKTVGDDVQGGIHLDQSHEATCWFLPGQTFGASHKPVEEYTFSVPALSFESSKILVGIVINEIKIAYTSYEATESQ